MDKRSRNANMDGMTKEEALRLLQRPGTPGMRRLIRALCVVYLLAIPVVPTAAVLGSIAVLPAGAWRSMMMVLSPLSFALCYVLVCGGLASLTRRAIIPGKMPRDLGHFVYGPRRLYALCWTAIYYFPPLYQAILSLAPLKRVTFRLFGYSGSLDFVAYPDTWIRDLPLLEIGPGAYIANRATLGTNICLKTGDIVINRIKIGARAMIGHLAILGLGDEIGDEAEVGVGTTFGVNVKIGARTVVGAIVGVNHGAQIGADCEVESMVYIGKKAVIHDGIRIHYASVVPDRAVVRTQEEADRYVPTQCTLTPDGAPLLRKVPFGSGIAPVDTSELA